MGEVHTGVIIPIEFVTPLLNREKKSEDYISPKGAYNSFGAFLYFTFIIMWKVSIAEKSNF